jgi:hypothetical protein
MPGRAGATAGRVPKGWPRRLLAGHGGLFRNLPIGALVDRVGRLALQRR